MVVRLRLIVAGLLIVPALAACSAPDNNVTPTVSPGIQVTGWVQSFGPPMCGGGCTSAPTAPAASPSGSRVAQAIVTLKPVNGGATTTATTDASGAFALSVPAGHFTIQASCRNVGLNTGETKSWPIDTSNGAPTPIALDCPYSGSAPG